MLAKSDFAIEISCIKKIDRFINPKKHELLFSDGKKIHMIPSDAVFVDLLEYNGFIRHNLDKYLCLKPEKIKELTLFITSILEKTKKCMILIPNETYIEDFVEIFDEALFNEDLQKFFF